MLRLGSSREYRRIVQLATEIISIARVGRVGEDPREDVRVGVGVVEFQRETVYIRTFVFTNLNCFKLLNCLTDAVD